MTSTSADASGRRISRRTAVAGVGAIAFGGPVLAACEMYGKPEPAPAEGTVLGDAADIPVGGGTVFTDAKVVVTQPAEGDFKGFTAVCTHQGCIVEKVDGGTINCTTSCGHGSRFDFTDGSVANGPAARPLATVPVSVNDNGEIVAGEQAQSAPTEEPTEEPQAQGEIATTDQIPVGGGEVFAEQKVVITQPTAGEFKGFSAVCKHQGCIVAGVAGGTINCDCHGSKYDIADASVVGGPAPAPLDPQEITVEGDQISLA